MVGPSAPGTCSGAAVSAGTGGAGGAGGSGWIGGCEGCDAGAKLGVDRATLPPVAGRAPPLETRAGPLEETRGTPPPPLEETRAAFRCRDPSVKAAPDSGSTCTVSDAA